MKQPDLKDLTPDRLAMYGDRELLALLFIHEDRLPRAAVDECVSRGIRLVDPLEQIIRDEHHWDCRDQEWWAVIHATYILGAIGGDEVTIPLLASLRLSDKYENDWIIEPMGSLLGALGAKALEPLRQIVLDRSNNWSVRAAALDGLAAIAAKHHNLERQILDFCAQALTDRSEDRRLRGTAGGIIMDFDARAYERSLREFGEEESRRHEQDSFDPAFFDSAEVDRAIALGERRIGHYIDDWLKFYDPREIALRQKRWHREGAWYLAPLRWWDRLRLHRSLRKFADRLESASR